MRDMETNNHTPNNLREIRMNMEMRQIDVAEMLNQASSDRISHWEKGVAFPGLINLFKLSIIYRVSPESLFPDLYASLAQELGSIPFNPQRETLETASNKIH
jgi:transcriptional regulator with XRE-family HTH domain